MPTEALIKYFANFNIDIITLCNEINDIETILPKLRKHLTVSHVQQIIQNLDEDSEQLALLYKMITPKSPLNSSGVLN